MDDACNPSFSSPLITKLIFPKYFLFIEIILNYNYRKALFGLPLYISLLNGE